VRLAPDQRAVLELVLRQGRSYGELSELLGIPERDVRARADAGVRALAGDPQAGVDSGRIADWLLGQQPDAEAERTRAAVARNPLARDWAAAAAGQLRELGGTVPAVPDGDEPAAPRDAAPRADEPAAAAAPRPRELRDRASRAPAAGVPRSSRLGGAVLIAVLLLVVGGALYLILGRGDDDEPQATAPASETAATATPTTTGNDIVLQGPGDSKAAGLLRLIRREDGAVQFAIAAQDVPANKGREVYAVWFTREGGTPRRLGFAQSQVTKEGVLTTGGPQQGDEDEFPRWFATYEKVLVTRETDAKAKTPGPAVLEGTLPAGGG
jgi:Sigma-70, region 4